MQELILIENQEEFEKALNQATGYNQKLPVPKHLKFNAEDGEWLEETDKKDEKGKIIYTPIGENIDLHIVISNRKMATSKYGSKNFSFYSHEYTGNYVELYSSEEKGKIIDAGLYKNLKVKYGEELVFIQVLYVYYNGNPYRIKLSGSKLENLFNLLNESNPALYITTAFKGERLKNGAVSYYALNFKIKEKADIKTIVERVNSFNKYINAYSEAKNAPTGQILPDLGQQDDFFDGTPVIQQDEESTASIMMRQGLEKSKNIEDIDLSQIPF